MHVPLGGLSRSRTAARRFSRFACSTPSSGVYRSTAASIGTRRKLGSTCTL